jgi:hypothetical protein
MGHAAGQARSGHEVHDLSAVSAVSGAVLTANWC